MKRSIIAYVQGRKSRTSIGTRSLDPIYTVSYYINWVLGHTVSNFAIVIFTIK